MNLQHGDFVWFTKCRSLPNKQPDIELWVVFDFSETHVDICRPEEFIKYHKKELGTVTINGKQFYEVPYHVGVLYKDVEKVQKDKASVE